ncbi:unnamed protein product [Paramecium sonneborni]|uniref:J domain-containing protein n=1 Tax=Paramecium sonneborni TaxID=65129 RepID=A0A8S1LE50_9CILI|nr:unnamed protein product [Paramecium sonneborni]
MLLRKTINYFSIFTSKIPKTYYEILEVTPKATTKEIKLQYIKLVKLYHPDNGESGSEEKFKEISKAYQVLKDPIKRQLYDSDALNFEQSGEAHSANDVNPDSYFYSTNKKEYYSNKWYNFRKPSYETLHQEQTYQFVDELTSKAIIGRVLIILGVYAIWDIYRLYSRRQHKKFLETQKEILDSSFIQAPLEQYIDKRQTEMQLDLD